LPLYRQEDFFTRHGLHIARSTQCDWVQAAAELLRPLYERQKELLLKSPVLWTDDTPVTLLGGGQEGSRQGRFWAYIAEEHPYSVYDFTESRVRDGPANIFLGSNDAVREVACWAHARRKFFEAIHSSPRDTHQLLEWIRQLYDIEDRARTWTEAARAALRQHEAEPVLDRIEAYLAYLEHRALPKSVLAKAVSYAQNQWQALRRYTTDGRLSIDNNVSERTLRHQAIGRKNWLFLGSWQAGPRAAVLFTILAGAKRHRIEPWTYLRELFLRLHGDDSRLDEMLPDKWAANHPESVLTYRLEESRRKAAAKSTRRRHARATRPTC
jgi:transposase